MVPAKDVSCAPDQDPGRNEGHHLKHKPFARAGRAAAVRALELLGLCNLGESMALSSDCAILHNPVCWSG
jgi:hypothetical protein